MVCNRRTNHRRRSKWWRIWRTSTPPSKWRSKSRRRSSPRTSTERSVNQRLNRATSYLVFAWITYLIIGDRDRKVWTWNSMSSSAASAGSSRRRPPWRRPSKNWRLSRRNGIPCTNTASASRRCCKNWTPSNRTRSKRLHTTNNVCSFVACSTWCIIGEHRPRGSYEEQIQERQGWLAILRSCSIHHRTGGDCCGRRGELCRFAFWMTSGTTPNSMSSNTTYRTTYVVFRIMNTSYSRRLPKEIEMQLHKTFEDGSVLGPKEVVAIVALGFAFMGVYFGTKEATTRIWVRRQAKKNFDNWKNPTQRLDRATSYLVFQFRIMNNACSRKLQRRNMRLFNLVDGDAQGPKELAATVALGCIIGGAVVGCMILKDRIVDHQWNRFKKRQEETE